jgi:sugar lactone lactonase YvrE
VVRLPLGGGAPAVLATQHGLTGAEGIAVDESGVYWTNHTEGAVMKVCPNGGAPVVFAAAQTNPNGIATDATHVYWTSVDPKDGQVLKALK